MSSAASPEETPDDASPDHSDGGSSTQLTQGEIIFTTLLSFVVLVAFILGIYAVYIHRKNPPMDQNGDAKRRPSHGQGTEISYAVDIDNEVDDAENGSRHVPGSRRGNMEMSGNDGNKSGQVRRSTMGNDSVMRPQGTELSRRASCSEIGPNVSSRYKLAAIEHMNHISTTGRHD